jgi:ABC-2 type transport system ATP-binding protein
LIQVTNLSKRYGPHKAVDNVSFTVEKGEIVGFLGPNGAGKSTTMNILTGYLSSSEGDVIIDGQNILEDPEEIKAKIGYLPENPPLYFDMTVQEYLRFVCEIKNVSRNDISQRIEYGLETVRISDVRSRLIKNLSKGYKQRVGLAACLMGNPQILILDEPTSGLDPKQIIEIRDLIRELGKDHTVVLSSHILHEVSETCERVLIMNLGRIVADGQLDTLARSLADTSELAVRISGEKSAVETALGSVSQIKALSVSDSPEPDSVDVLIESEENTDLRKEVFFALSKAKIPILQMRTKNMTLEEIFLHLTSSEKGVE